MKKENLKRTFDLSLKLDLVKQIERGELRVSEVSKIYGLSATAIYKWLHKYSEMYKKKDKCNSGTEKPIKEERSSPKED